jgi:hypothetical protein
MGKLQDVCTFATHISELRLFGQGDRRCEMQRAAFLPLRRFLGLIRVTCRDAGFAGASFVANRAILGGLARRP